MTNAIQQATLTQRQAAAPKVNAWVEANAGTGKTKLLTDRLLNLLLAGARPEGILCLTFTKAAAAEMATRLQDRLGRWAVISTEALIKELLDLTGDAPDAKLQERARSLFARVLDAPGGMKIRTIHAFCQSLLGQFPLEAGLTPGFQVLDDADAQDLQEQATLQVFLAGHTHPHLLEALRYLTLNQHERNLPELIQAILGNRQHLFKIQETYPEDAQLQAALWKSLGLSEGITRDRLLADLCEETNFNRDDLTYLLECYRAGTKTEQGRADILQRWLACATSQDRLAMAEDYRRVYLTATDTLFKTGVYKATLEKNPRTLKIWEWEADRVFDLLQQEKLLAMAQRTLALLRFAKSWLETYERLKAQRHVLDYEDLLQRAAALLQSTGLAPWVLYKIDGGIEHILVDEAQDTNPLQWEIVRALADEFFSGADAGRFLPRTVFAVGDVKQSIYSFQGAAPDLFSELRQHFRQKSQGAKAPWQDVKLNVSFRSTPAILQAVDEIFSHQPASTGVVTDSIEHVSSRAGQAGRVEVWPLVPYEDKEKTPDTWQLPHERSYQRDAPSRLAQAIAAQIDQWIKSGETLTSKARPIQAGDILVLIRNRSKDNFISQLIASLKAHNIPVAGVDRMVLNEQLAVQDLMALGEFLLLPEDDLTLATLLKSPFIGLSEDELFTLCHNRGELTLWQAINRQSHRPFQQAARWLRDILLYADARPVFELYTDILTTRAGRRKLVQRLGPQVNDPIDEFLNQALHYDQQQGGGLQGFLHHMRHGHTEIKRDLEGGHINQVRLMTVHSAKGLQAPIVFLADTTSEVSSTMKLLPQGEFLYWSLNKDKDPQVFQDWREEWKNQQQAEFNRLLYVAMTRAEDRLYVCGWQHGKGKEVNPNTWYGMITNGLQGVAQSVDMDMAARFKASWADDWSGTGRVLENAQTAQAVPTVLPAEDAAANLSLPDWIQQPAAPLKSPPQPLNPSRLAELPSRGSVQMAEPDSLALQRGNCVHKLLEILPRQEAGQWAALAPRMIEKLAPTFEAKVKHEIAQQVLAILNNDSFASLFGPDSRAEVPIIGLWEDTPVSGQIDRLVVRDQDILILDYKTNLSPPATVEEVPAAYLKQLGAYTHLLGQMYPHHTITAAILWTATADLMQIPANLLLSPFAQDTLTTAAGGNTSRS